MKRPWSGEWIVVMIELELRSSQVWNGNHLKKSFKFKLKIPCFVAMNTTGNHQADILEISCQCQICLKSTYHILIYLKIEKNIDKDEAPSSKSSQCCDKWCFCSWQTFERFELEKKKKKTPLRLLKRRRFSILLPKRDSTFRIKLPAIKPSSQALNKRWHFSSEVEFMIWGKSQRR